MKEKPRTLLRYIVKTLKGKEVDGIYYKLMGQAELFAPTPSLILKVWVTESKWK